MTGTITRLIHLRGYGFICDEQGNSRFLHATDLVDAALWPALREGQLVKFEPTVRKQGFGVTGVDRA